jgi:hypothetical protein
MSPRQRDFVEAGIQRDSIDQEHLQNIQPMPVERDSRVAL